MSKTKRRLWVLCTLLLAVTMAFPAFAGCTKKPKEPTVETQCTVTFDKNTSHATNVLQPKVVENGQTVTPPQVFITDVDETNRFKVDGWYTSKDCKEDEKWDFATPVTKSMTLYAAWEEYVKVEFYLGAAAETPASVQWVLKGQKAAREDGLAGNYKLEGYYSDTGYNDEFDFDAAVNADRKLYLKFDATKAYMFATHLAAMSFGYPAHYIYESKYCPTHRIEVTGEACAESGCDATLVDPATVTTKYCPDCRQDIAADAVAQDGTHTDCSAETDTHAHVQDPAGDVAAKQRPEGFYTASVSKQTQDATETDEGFDYARFDFGNLQQPYAWYNPLNVNIKGKNMLTIKYRNMGKGKAIRFYYVMGYEKEGGGYDYSGNGMFANFVDVEIGAADEQWHSVDVDMGAKTMSKIDGVSEWGAADLLSIFRIDYPYGAYGANEYKDYLVKPGDSVLDVAEIVFWDDEKDYSPKDTLDFEDYDEGAPTDVDWTWSVDEENGARLYNKDGAPTAYFPYNTTGNTLTATVAETNSIDCDADEYKALTINYDNLGYGTSATLTWRTDKSEGSKNVSLEANDNNKTIYLNMAGESTWTGTLESLTLTYVKKGVNNAITINAITINAPKPEDIAGYSFRYSANRFTGTYNVEKASMVVDATGITKTAATGETVLDVNNAIVYKGFTVWYTQGETEATELTLTYTDASDVPHAATATLTSGTGEKSVSLTFLNTNGRSAMSGKIKEFKLATDAGSVFVPYVYFDLDVHDSWYDLTEEGTVRGPNMQAATSNPIVDGAWSTNFGLAVSHPVSMTPNTTVQFDENRHAWQFTFMQGGYFLLNLPTFSVRDVLVTRNITIDSNWEGKLYVVLNNTMTNGTFNVYVGCDEQVPSSDNLVTVNNVATNMSEGSWTVMEVDISALIANKTTIHYIQVSPGGTGNRTIYIRGLILR